MKSMHMTTHADDDKIPKGMAALSLTDSGWVGTNNGYPLGGQPALFPEAQAHAICYAWNTYSLHPIPYPEGVTPEVIAWLT